MPSGPASAAPYYAPSTGYPTSTAPAPYYSPSAGYSAPTMPPPPGPMPSVPPIGGGGVPTVPQPYSPYVVVTCVVGYSGDYCQFPNNFSVPGGTACNCGGVPGQTQ
jgi:hypothetical protein